MFKIKKEMKYLATPIKKKILYKNHYKGFLYVVVSFGTHPCCYVEIPKNTRYYSTNQGSEILEGIPIHGGITFADYRTDFKRGKKFFIGWDYAHGDDFIGSYLILSIFETMELRKLKQWTTDEMIEDCKKVIDYILDNTSDSKE